MREWREKTSDSNEYTHLRFLSCILHLLLLSPHAINSEMGFSRIFLVIFSPFFRLLSFRFVPFLLSLSPLLPKCFYFRLKSYCFLD